MSAALEARNVSKTYGKGETAVTALDKINLIISAGESVAVLGKSGSGKSTLVHLLSLLDKPSQGTVLVGDQDASKMGARQVDSLRNKEFGFVFQQFFLNRKQTVLDNVILPLKIARVGRKERLARGFDSLRSVQLEAQAGRAAADLSGGQMQRVCIARALINNPKVIFADEPTGNLDSSTGQAVADQLFELNKAHGITLVVVTHDEDLARRCERQVHIKDGALSVGDLE